MDIVGGLQAAYGASPIGAILLVVIGIVLGIIIDKMLGMAMMGMGMV